MCSSSSGSSSSSSGGSSRGSGSGDLSARLLAERLTLIGACLPCPCLETDSWQSDGSHLTGQLGLELGQCAGALKSWVNALKSSRTLTTVAFISEGKLRVV